jgi:hypothetical protein
MTLTKEQLKLINTAREEIKKLSDLQDNEYNTLIKSLNITDSRSIVWDYVYSNTDNIEFLKNI